MKRPARLVTATSVLMIALMAALGGCGGDPGSSSRGGGDPNAGAPIDPHDNLNYECAPPGPDGALYDGIDTFTNGSSNTVIFGRAWLRDPKDIRLIGAGFIPGVSSYGLGYTWPKGIVPVAGYRLQPGKKLTLVLHVALTNGESGHSPGPDVTYTAGGARYTYYSTITVAMKKGNCN